MKEIVIIIWTALVFICGIVFMYTIKRKRRKLGKYVAIQKVVLLLLSFGLGWLLYFFWGKSPHLIWITRLTVLVFAAFHLWSTYSQSWTVRDKYSYKDDSIFPEFLLVLFHALLFAIGFTVAPQVTGLVNMIKVDVSLTLWDLPIVFLFPFLILKLSDISSQVPFRIVENRWIYPLEPLNVENWPWRDLMQVNFQVKNSLQDEYIMFGWPARPWIEAPREVPLGDVFRLAMQERRRRQDLTTVQDLGDEYVGDPKFWWLFSVKVIWWNPGTWFRSPRYLNPALSAIANKLKKNDVILARRVPMSEAYNTDGGFFTPTDYDSDKTVIIHR